jgi:hypothetical protein
MIFFGLLIVLYDPIIAPEVLRIMIMSSSFKKKLREIYSFGVSMTFFDVLIVLCAPSCTSSLFRKKPKVNFIYLLCLYRHEKKFRS